MLVGLDAHALHHFAKLLGSRYQDVVARVSAPVAAAQALTRPKFAKKPAEPGQNFWRVSVGLVERRRDVDARFPDRESR